jgi:hypothetical protein
VTRPTVRPIPIMRMAGNSQRLQKANYLQRKTSIGFLFLGARKTS